LVGINRKYFLAIIVLGLLIFFFNLGGRDLWDPDETRYAVVAREMRDTGQWVLPHLNGEVYAEKPPLFFWLVNLSTFFFGKNTEFTNRLPSALAGFIILFVTFLFGEKLFNLRVGFISAMVLATCILLPRLSRWMMLDSLFTLFFLLTLYCFYLGYDKEGSRRKYYLLAGIFIGLGVLAKGPIGYLTIPIFLIFSFFQKNMKKFWNGDLLRGCMLSVILVLIWWVPACWIGGRDYIHWLLIKQAVGTYVEGGTHFHPEPFYFYFIRFPLEFLPWIVFLPTACILGLRKEFGKRKEFLFLSIWFCFIFIFFTLSKGKKDNYLLPLYPAAAMMVGSLWDFGFQSEEGRKGSLWGLVLLTFLFLAGFVLLLLRIPQRFYPDSMDYQALGLCIVFYLLAGSFLSLLFFFKKKKWASLISLIITFAFLHLHVSYSVLPNLDPQRSAKAFAERILKRMEIGDGLKTYFLNSNGLLYYSKKSYIESIQDKDRFLEIFRSPQRVFIVMYSEMLNDVNKETGMKLSPVDQATVGHWDYALILNH
jgi:4-amino-4-deoxy-L-arabinose transferase-like glycosyltransferase